MSLENKGRQYWSLLLLPIVLLFILANISIAFDQVSQPSSQESLYRSIAPYAEIYRDPDRALDYPAITRENFRPLTSFLNFGYSDDAIWLRLTLEQKDFPGSSWLIQFGIPYLDHIDSYQEVQGDLHHYVKGREVSLTTSPYPHRDSIIPVIFDQGQATIYLKIQSRDGTSINAMLMPEPEFLQHDRKLQMFIGIYIGLMLAMAFYNFFMFVTMHDKRYGFYVLFTLAILLNVMAQYELLHEYVFIGTPWLNLRLTHITSFLTGLTAAEMVRSFLQSKETMPFFNRLMLGLHFFNVLIFIYALLAGSPTTLWFYLQTLIFLGLVIGGGIRAFFIGDDIFAKSFLAAFGLFIVGLFLLGARRFGWFPPNPFVNYTFMAGSAVETMVLSFVLAQRINLLREQKQVAQSQLIEKISEYNSHLEEMKLDLEKKVKVRTHKLSKSLSEKDLLLKEVHHRVKNNLAVIVSLLGFQIMNNAPDSPVGQALKSGQSRIRSMALVHELLCKGDDLSEIDTQDYFQQLSWSLLSSFGAPDQEIIIECDVDKVQLPMDVLVACGLVATELLSNAMKHAFANCTSGQIDMSLKTCSEGLILTVTDNGCGLEPACRENLGMRFVRMMTEQLNGTLGVNVGPGTSWRLSFPVPEEGI